MTLLRVGTRWLRRIDSSRRSALAELEVFLVDVGLTVEVSFLVDVGLTVEVGFLVDVGLTVEVGFLVDVGLTVEVGFLVEVGFFVDEDFLVDDVVFLVVVAFVVGEVVFLVEVVSPGGEMVIAVVIPIVTGFDVTPKTEEMMLSTPEVGRAVLLKREVTIDSIAEVGREVVASLRTDEMIDSIDDVGSVTTEVSPSTEEIMLSTPEVGRAVLLKAEVTIDSIAEVGREVVASLRTDEMIDSIEEVGSALVTPLRKVGSSRAEEMMLSIAEVGNAVLLNTEVTIDSKSDVGIAVVASLRTDEMTDSIADVGSALVIPLRKVGSSSADEMMLSTAEVGRAVLLSTEVTIDSRSDVGIAVVASLRADEMTDSIADVGSALVTPPMTEVSTITDEMILSIAEVGSAVLLSTEVTIDSKSDVGIAVVASLNTDEITDPIADVGRPLKKVGSAIADEMMLSMTDVGSAVLPNTDVTMDSRSEVGIAVVASLRTDETIDSMAVVGTVSILVGIDGTVIVGSVIVGSVIVGPPRIDETMLSMAEVGRTEVPPRTEVTSDSISDVGKAEVASLRIDEIIAPMEDVGRSVGREVGRSEVIPPRTDVASLRTEEIKEVGRFDPKSEVRSPMMEVSTLITDEIKEVGMLPAKSEVTSPRRDVTSLTTDGTNDVGIAVPRSEVMSPSTEVSTLMIDSMTDVGNSVVGKAEVTSDKIDETKLSTTDVGSAEVTPSKAEVTSLTIDEISEVGKAVGKLVVISPRIEDTTLRSDVGRAVGNTVERSVGRAKVILGRVGSGPSRSVMTDDTSDATIETTDVASEMMAEIKLGITPGLLIDGSISEMMELTMLGTSDVGTTSVIVGRTDVGKSPPRTLEMTEITSDVGTTIDGDVTSDKIEDTMLGMTKVGSAMPEGSRSDTSEVTMLGMSDVGTAPVGRSVVGRSEVGKSPPRTLEMTEITSEVGMTTEADVTSDRIDDTMLGMTKVGSAMPDGSRSETIEVTILGTKLVGTTVGRSVGRSVGRAKVMLGRVGSGPSRSVMTDDTSDATIETTDVASEMMAEIKLGMTPGFVVEGSISEMMELTILGTSDVGTTSVIVGRADVGRSLPRALEITEITSDGTITDGEVTSDKIEDTTLGITKVGSAIPEGSRSETMEVIMLGMSEVGTADVGRSVIGRSEVGRSSPRTLETTEITSEVGTTIEADVTSDKIEDTMLGMTKVGSAMPEGSRSETIEVTMLGMSDVGTARSVDVGRSVIGRSEVGRSPPRTLEMTEITSEVGTTTEADVTSDKIEDTMLGMTVGSVMPEGSRSETMELTMLGRALVPTTVAVSVTPPPSMLLTSDRTSDVGIATEAEVTSERIDETMLGMMTVGLAMPDGSTDEIIDEIMPGTSEVGTTMLLVTVGRPPPPRRLVRRDTTSDVARERASDASEMTADTKLGTTPGSETRLGSAVERIDEMMLGTSEVGTTITSDVGIATEAEVTSERIDETMLGMMTVGLAMPDGSTDEIIDEIMPGTSEVGTTMLLVTVGRPPPPRRLVRRDTTSDVARERASDASEMTADTKLGTTPGSETRLGSAVERIDEMMLGTSEVGTTMLLVTVGRPPPPRRLVTADTTSEVARDKAPDASEMTADTRLGTTPGSETRLGSAVERMDEMRLGMADVGNVPSPIKLETTDCTSDVGTTTDADVASDRIDDTMPERNVGSATAEGSTADTMDEMILGTAVVATGPIVKVAEISTPPPRPLSSALEITDWTADVGTTTDGDVTPDRIEETMLDKKVGSATAVPEGSTAETIEDTILGTAVVGTAVEVTSERIDETILETSVGLAIAVPDGSTAETIEETMLGRAVVGTAIVAPDKIDDRTSDVGIATEAEVTSERIDETMLGMMTVGLAMPDGSTDEIIDEIMPGTSEVGTTMLLVTVGRPPPPRRLVRRDTTSDVARERASDASEMTADTKLGTTPGSETRLGSAVERIDEMMLGTSEVGDRTSDVGIATEAEVTSERIDETMLGMMTVGLAMPDGSTDEIIDEIMPGTSEVGTTMLLVTVGRPPPPRRLVRRDTTSDVARERASDASEMTADTKLGTTPGSETRLGSAVERIDEMMLGTSEVGTTMLLVTVGRPPPPRRLVTADTTSEVARDKAPDASEMTADTRLGTTPGSETRLGSAVERMDEMRLGMADVGNVPSPIKLETTDCTSDVGTTTDADVASDRIDDTMPERNVGSATAEGSTADTMDEMILGTAVVATGPIVKVAEISTPPPRPLSSALEITDWTADVGTTTDGDVTPDRIEETMLDKNVGSAMPEGSAADTIDDTMLGNAVVGTAVTPTEVAVAKLEMMLVTADVGSTTAVVDA
nr:hypothetical protein CFP56_33581 [Quercus suber]